MQYAVSAICGDEVGGAGAKVGVQREGSINVSEAVSPRRDSLDRFTKLALAPLKPEWRDAEQQTLLAEARAAEASGGTDAYWAWAASHLRWIKPWDKVREGDIQGFEFYSGGLLNVCDNCVDRHAEAPDGATRTAIIWEGENGECRKWSYAELHEKVCRLANGLKGLGVGQGDVVAIFMPNLLETFAAIHACNRIGAVYTILFSGFSEEAVNVRLSAAGAKVVIACDVSARRGKIVSLLATLRGALDKAEHDLRVVMLRRDPGTSLRDSEIDFAALVAENPPVCDIVPLDPNAPAFLIFTSGTEAKPKGLIHSVGGFLVGAWANVQWQIGLKRDDVYWCTADVGWLTFPIQTVIGGLAHGGTLLCTEGSLDYPSIDRLYDVAERHNVTKILTAPTALRMLRSKTRRDHALPKLKLISVQGEPLDPETFAWSSAHFGAHGVPVVNGYGQTETGSTWTYPVYGVDSLKPGSCGTPVPGHQCLVVDENGQPCARGVQGLIILTAPFPTLARTLLEGRDTFVEKYLSRFAGCFATSDEAVFDDDGHLWVLGRADDVINVAAHRISTIELEAAVSATPGVAEAAVVGVADAIKGTVPIAFVSLRPDAVAEVVKAEAPLRAEAAMGAIARLSRVIIIPAFPKSRAGKIMRRLLRDLVEAGAPRQDISSLEDAASIEPILEALRTQG